MNLFFRDDVFTKWRVFAWYENFTLNFFIKMIYLHFLFFISIVSSRLFVVYTSSSQLEQARIPEIQYNGGTTDGHIATKRQIPICRLQSHNVSLP